MFQTNLIVLSKSLWLYQNKVCEKCQTFESFVFSAFLGKGRCLQISGTVFPAPRVCYTILYSTLCIQCRANPRTNRVFRLDDHNMQSGVMESCLHFFMALNVRSFTKVTWGRTDLYTAALMLHNTLPKYWLLAIMSRDGWHSQIYYNASTLQTLTELLYPRYRWVTGLSFYGNQSATHTGKMKIQLLLFRQTA